jgi:predicted metal-dependent peptidase
MSPAVRRDPETERLALEAYSESRALQAAFKVPGVRKSATLFFTSLLLRLEPVADWGVETAATDGKQIRFNPAFFLGLSMEGRFGLNAHEVYHVALAHHARQGERDPYWWNVATDLAINPILVESGFKVPGRMLMPGRGEYAKLPAGLSAEEYYYLLTRPPERQPQERKNDGEGERPEDQEEPEQDAGQGDQGEGEGGGEEQEGEGGTGGDQGDEGGGGQGGEAHGEAAAPGAGGAPGQGGQPGQGSAGPQRDPGGSGGVIPPGHNSPDERRHEEGKWQVAVAQAAQLAKRQGDVPAWLERLVAEALQPKEDWRGILREFISKQAKDEHRWSRPNRRFLQQGVYLPSLRSDELGDVIVTVDCSGSIGQRELDVFAGELRGILETFGCTLTVLHHDIPVTHVQRWEPTDGPLRLKPHGGGGTSHVPVFEWIRENAAEGTPCVVAFTDLYTEFPAKTPHLPVLWAVCGGGSAYHKRPEPPFGRVVEIRA